jgi:hypothetical protein
VDGMPAVEVTVVPRRDISSDDGDRAELAAFRLVSRRLQLPEYY